jgi:hypothetical protein
MYLQAPVALYSLDRKHLERGCDVEHIEALVKGGERGLIGVRLHHRDSGLVIEACEGRTLRRNQTLALGRLHAALDQINAHHAATSDDRARGLGTSHNTASVLGRGSR